MPTRQQMWDRLAEPADLLVVGGGITGCGIARDAVMRGLKVVVVEAYDFAFGTSSRSSKLVHGGLRYLEQYEFSLVFESVSERRVLMDIAPHLVHPLGFLFPVFKGSRQPMWMINAGMWLYDGLSLFRSPKMHRSLDRKAALAEEPLLRATDLKGAPLYYDCATDDARLTLENGLDAARMGAVVCPRARVVRFLRGESGRIEGAVVRDEATGTEVEVRAAAVVNATGPWADRTLALSETGAAPLLRPTKGVHIVVQAARLPVRHAVVAFHPVDGRVLFAIPWGDRTYIGTTDTDFQGDPAEVVATSADVAYLLDAANAYFPNQKLVPGDVISTWAGLRPLMAPPPSDGSMRASQVSREHHIHIGADGLITIAGGKLTTYRRMAAEVVESVVHLLHLSGTLSRRLNPAPTDKEPLPGAVGWPEDDEIGKLVGQIAADAGLEEDIARNLLTTYGMRAVDLARRVAADDVLRARLIPGRPEILGQVDWAVREELASEVSDVLVRRTQIYYRDVDQGLTAVDAVAARMGGLLGWSAERQAASAAAYVSEVAQARAWRSEAS